MPRTTLNRVDLFDLLARIAQLACYETMRLLTNELSYDDASCAYQCVVQGLSALPAHPVERRRGLENQQETVLACAVWCALASYGRMTSASWRAAITMCYPGETGTVN
jgi:hypothetical protein